MDHPSSENQAYSRSSLLALFRNRLSLTLFEKFLGILLHIHDGRAVLKHLIRMLRRELEDGCSDELDYRTFRTILNQYPERLRDDTWYQASILLDASWRKYPERTFNHLRLLRERNDPQDFAQFWEELRLNIAPYSLTPHGYMLALESRDKEGIWKEITQIISLLDTMELHCFLNSGTLLGIIREGGFLPHDDDVDLAVILNADSDREASRQWISFGERLKYSVRPPYKLDLGQTILYKIICPSGLEVDLFPAWVSRGHVFVWPYLHGELKASDLLPLRPINEKLSSVFLPANPEAFLEINYGSNWKIPDPSFRFDWNRAKQQFTIFTKTLKD